jgi:hypothetical protein
MPTADRFRHIRLLGVSSIGIETFAEDVNRGNRALSWRDFDHGFEFCELCRFRNATFRHSLSVGDRPVIDSIVFLKFIQPSGLTGFRIWLGSPERRPTEAKLIVLR